MKNNVLRARPALLIESQAARSLLTASDMMQVNVLEAVYIYIYSTLVVVREGLICLW